MHIKIQWQPGIGDPTLTGWVTVAGYFLAAAVCSLAYLAAAGRTEGRKIPSRHDMHFWKFVAIIMTFLGFNKQLDLQTLFTQIGSYFAHMGGWYDQRQTVQLLFVIALSCSGAVAAFILLWILRKLATEIRIASVGLCMLATFIVIRAASFHHVDKFLGGQFVGMRWNAILELGSIIIIMAAALSYRRNHRISREGGRP